MKQVISFLLLVLLCAVRASDLRGISVFPAVIWRDCLGFRHKGGVVTGPVNGYYKKTSNGLMNMVFADGHCEVQKFQEVESLTTPSSAPFFTSGGESGFEGTSSRLCRNDRMFIQRLLRMQVNA